MIIDAGLSIYPQLFSIEETSTDSKNDPIFYQFKGGDLSPNVVKYQVGEEVKEIELNKLIRKMKHDKAAFAWLNQHKPNGGPQWPQGGSGQFYLVISNDPFLNFTKSSGRYWEQNSCERYESYQQNYSHGPISDIKFGNCVVFAFKGAELPPNWPEVQPNNTRVNIDTDADGILLGRQNIKWGYKENSEEEGVYSEGDIGMGLDPAFYPRSGGASWPNLLNRALAIIVDSIGYLNYDSLRTPYKYIGHCDVGSGMGILTYDEGTTCYTKIDERQVNPNLIMASNENMGFVTFDRLTRPIVELNIKMILAQNPNIWAIDGNEVGIARLIRTKNPDILRFLIASPDADTEALSSIIDLLDELSQDWYDISNNSSLAYLIAQHPNANEEIYRKLLRVFTIKNITEDGNIKDSPFWGVAHLFAGVGLPYSNTPYICVAGNEIIESLLNSLDTQIPVDWRVKIIYALLFAPQLTKRQYIKLIPHIQSALAERLDFENGVVEVTEHDSSYQIIMKCMYAYILPLDVKDSWGHGDFDGFSFSSYIRFTFITSRQSPLLLDILKPYLYKKQIDTSQVVNNTRNQKCYNWIWRRRRGLGLEPETLLRYPYGVYDRDLPFNQSFFNEGNFINCLKEGSLNNIGVEFIPQSSVVADNTNNLMMRDEYPISFVKAVLSNEDYIQNIGWGEVAMWLRSEAQFYQYIDLVYRKAFKNLYLGNGRLSPPPTDLFELYESIENINILNDASIGTPTGVGGLCKNPYLPIEFQKLLYDDWLKISIDYEGSYEEDYFTVLECLSKNTNTNPKILDSIYSESPLELGNSVAQNPNTYMKTLMKLYSTYPSKVMTNLGLSDASYAKLWNNVWKVLNIPLLENPNRLFDKFRTSCPNLLEANKGMTLRKSIIKFITENSYAKFWRAGNIKKGKFSQIQSKNLFTEPIADYPIMPNGKVMVIKFYEHADEHFKNELWKLDTLKKIDEDTVFVEGVKEHWEGDVRKSTEVSQNYPINEFFDYIPESERGEDTIQTGDDGEENIVKASRWNIDNIVVIQDIEVQTKGENIPEWRFDINQKQVNEILASYIERGRDISKLIEDLENYRNMKNYELSLSQLFSVIDDLNLWTVDLINDNLSFLMRSRAGHFSGLKNIRPTEKILNLSIAESLEDIKEMEIYDVGLNDLPALQKTILDFENIPIAYIYYVLVNSRDSAVLRKAKELRKQRSKEFIQYYRLKNPAPTRK